MSRERCATAIEGNGDRATWTYDDTNQLTREQRPGDKAYDITYGYDSVGNRLTKETGGVITTSTCDAGHSAPIANSAVVAARHTGGVPKSWGQRNAPTHSWVRRLGCVQKPKRSRTLA